MDVHPYDDPLPGPGEHNPCFEQIAAFRCSDSALGLCLWLTWLPWQPNCHGPLEMARWKVGKTQMTWIINESKWPKMKGLLAVSESWWTHSQLLQLSRLCRKSSWQDAMECRMPRKNRIFDKKSDKLDRLVHHPDISSRIFSTFHWLRMALDTQKASTPQLCIWLQHGWRLFSEPRSNRNIFGIFICSYIYVYIYTYTFFLNIVNDSWNSQMQYLLPPWCKRWMSYLGMELPVDACDCADASCANLNEG